MNIRNSLLIFLVLSRLMLFSLSSKPVYFTPSETYHLVKKGDTLIGISKRYNLSVEMLKMFNNLSSDRIYIGQKIHLYPPPVRKSEFVTVRSVPPGGYHVVRKGEDIYRIAKMYDVNIIDLVEYNKLSNLDIKTGQKLFLIKSDTDYAMSSETKEKQPEKKQIGREEKKTVQLEKAITDKLITKRYELILPVEGEVTSEFGLRNGKPHKGIDISAPVGTPIYAVMDGKVVYNGTQRGYGNVIILEHRNYIMTVYAHNEANLVRIGEKVKQGQPIASLGQTGTASGPHLHFEYRIQGKAIDPRKVLPQL